MDNAVDNIGAEIEAEANVEEADISVDTVAPMELKVIVTLKGDRGSIGISAPQCDPVFTIFEGGLQTALERLPGLVEEARSRWAQSPRYPKCQAPLPSQVQPPPQPVQHSAPRRQSGPKEGNMQRMF